jgi:hypothetical protein
MALGALVLLELCLGLARVGAAWTMLIPAMTSSSEPANTTTLSVFMGSTPFEKACRTILPPICWPKGKP